MSAKELKRPVRSLRSVGLYANSTVNWEMGRHNVFLTGIFFFGDFHLCVCVCYYRGPQ